MKKFLTGVAHIRAQFLWAGLDRPLDEFEPLPYIRRMQRNIHLAAISGFFCGVFAMAFGGTILANHFLHEWSIPVHGAAMICMAGALAGFCAINIHKLRLMPAALVGLILIVVGQFI